MQLCTSTLPMAYCMHPTYLSLRRQECRCRDAKACMNLSGATKHACQTLFRCISLAFGNECPNAPDVTAFLEKFKCHLLIYAVILQSQAGSSHPVRLLQAWRNAFATRKRPPKTENRARPRHRLREKSKNQITHQSEKNLSILCQKQQIFAS